jgi:hypothetical protein
MKRHVLKGPIVLLVLTTLQMGCNLSGKKIDSKTEFARANKLEDSAYAMQTKGNTDSSISYLKKSHSIYEELIKTVDSTKDTLYGNKLLINCNDFGGSYFSKGDFKTAIYYFSAGANWAKLLHSGSMQEFETEMIGHCYLEWGHDQSDKTIMRKGIPYINEACNIIDSLKIDTMRLASFTEIFSLAVNINARLGADTNKAIYYNTKYQSLKNNLHTTSTITQ